jgi:hypothetical protein
MLNQLPLLHLTMNIYVGHEESDAIGTGATGWKDRCQIDWKTDQTDARREKGLAIGTYLVMSIATTTTAYTFQPQIPFIRSTQFFT